VARLEDKIVLIAGAAGAIGQAVAAAVQREGGVAIATDLRGRGGIDHGLDVTAESDWHNVLAEVERAHGRLDGLVNAAGIALLASIEDTDYASWRRVLAVNLDGTFLGCKHALRLLKLRGGSIVNLSSIYGLVGRPRELGTGLDPYVHSKGGVVQLTRDMAVHFARDGVRVNALCPGFVFTNLTKALTDKPESRRFLEEKHPMGRLGQPDEIARAALFLASDDASFVTGACLPVDGGYTAQ
jgi:meso-butanediol dehydrogenase/(S,S)-butanediol dehydrogenase/diacetyl reductase